MPGALPKLFGSEARVKVLSLLMLHPASELYLREIAQRTGLPVRAVKRVVRSLTEIGPLHREQRGNSVYFSVNRGFPIFLELKALFLKTVGLGDRLREFFAHAGSVNAAFHLRLLRQEPGGHNERCGRVRCWRIVAWGTNACP